MGLGPIWRDWTFSEYKWAQLYICQVIIRWVYITPMSGDQLYLFAEVYSLQITEFQSLSESLRVLLVFSGYSGPSEYGLLKSCKGKTKAGKFEATAVRGEYSKNGAKVCKGRSSKIDRFLRCQLLSTFNFSHFQSWGCHTSKWRKHPNPMKCEIISLGDIDVFHVFEGQ